MSTIFITLSFIAFIIFILGLCNPNASLFFLKEKEKRTKKHSSIIYLIVWLGCGLLGAALDDSPSTSIPETTSSVDSLSIMTDEERAIKKEEEMKAASAWTYQESVDEMTDEKHFFAVTTSTNTAEFEFPYNGGSAIYLSIRNMNGKNDIYCKISKGQFMTSYADNEYIRVRFDGAKPVKYYYSMSNDGSNDIIFINNSKGLIDKIKTAKEIAVDFPFYQEGRVVFNFDTNNLKWEH